jgi:hypothetical protein
MPMGTLLFICFIIAIFHFVYESLILPSMILRLKFKYEKLKDEVIRIAIDQNGKIHEKEYNYMLHNIEILSRNMHNMTISTILNAERFFKEHPNIVKENNLMTINDVKNKRFKQIHRESIKMSLFALMFNSLMWAIYLLPIFFIAHIFGRTRKTYQKLIEKLSMTTDQNFDDVVNNGYCAI